MINYRQVVSRWNHVVALGARWEKVLNHLLMPIFGANCCAHFSLSRRIGMNPKIIKNSQMFSIGTPFLEDDMDETVTKVAKRGEKNKEY